LHGATQTTGQCNSALNFDGVDDYVQVPDSDSLDVVGSLSILAWIRKMDQSETDLIANKKFAYDFSTNTDGTLRVYIGTGGGWGSSLSGSVDAVDGSWHLVGFTYDDANNELIIYVDGAEDRRTTYTASLGSSSHELYIGRDPGASRFNGKIDEVKIYNKVLSASEIQAEMGCGGTTTTVTTTTTPTTSVTTSIPTTTITADEVAIWHFDENSGSTAGDSSGNNNDGTIYGAIWTSGKINSALYFDGNDDYVDIGDRDLLSTESKTFIAWVKPSSSAEGGGILIKTGGIGDREYQLLLIDGDPIFRLSHDCTQNIFIENSAYSVPANEWVMLAATYDHATKGLKLYYNGQPIASDTNAQGTVCTGGSAPLTIGSENGQSNFFNGVIDEVRIYSRALSESEIQQHYGS